MRIDTAQMGERCRKIRRANRRSVGYIAGLERGCRVSCDGGDAADGVEKAV